jgi:prepilin-type N-terminal cleavage/methylation domain-containing protein
MKHRHLGERSSRAGFTLLEMAVAAGLLAVFLGSTAFLGKSLLGAFRTETAQAQKDEALHLALDRMVQRLRTVDAEALLPVAVASSDWVEYQRASDHDGTNVIWGPLERLLFERDDGELDDGLDNDGDGLVDEGRVVWVREPGAPDERRNVLATGVPETGMGEIAGNAADDDGNGLEDEGGLAFEVVGGRMRIALTLVWLDEGGELQEIAAERSVTMRNTGVNSP